MYTSSRECLNKLRTRRAVVVRVSIRTVFTRSDELPNELISDELILLVINDSLNVSSVR